MDLPLIGYRRHGSETKNLLVRIVSEASVTDAPLHENKAYRQSREIEKEAGGYKPG